MSKQLILVRKDLNMPVGKVAAQVAHASMAALLSTMSKTMYLGTLTLHANYKRYADDHIIDWLTGSFTKVVVAVENDVELNALLSIAKEKNIPTSTIVDAGRTVFDGVQTLTCGAIGPSDEKLLDSFCRHLKLYN